MSNKFLLYFSISILMGAAFISPLETHADDVIIVDENKSNTTPRLKEQVIYEEWLDLSMGHRYYLSDQKRYGGYNNVDAGYAFFLQDYNKYRKKILRQDFTGR